VFNFAAILEKLSKNALKESFFGFGDTLNPLFHLSG
jgi:hypothetical protein